MLRRSRVPRRSGLAIAAVCLAALGPATPVAAATTWQYPSAQCPVNADHGLQDCVDGAAAGDTIELLSEIVDEPALISRSLTLRSDPTLRSRVESITVRDTLQPDVTVVLSDLRVRFLVRAVFDKGTGDHLTIRRLVVGRDESGPQGISVEAISPATVLVQGTYARTTGHQDASLQLAAIHSAGTSRFTLIGNELTQTGAVDGGSGVALQTTDSAEVDLHVLSNAIHHVAADNAGTASGVLIYAQGTSTVRADIVGNTIASSRSIGVGLVAAGDPGQSLDANVFNNIISHHDGPGFYVIENHPGTLTLRNDWNDVFASADDAFFVGAPGPHTLRKNPRYRNLVAGDLRLKATSPLIDAGRACTVGGLSRIDAAGRFRWAGREVDLGAYESGAGRPSGVVRIGTAGANILVGTNGRDVLCGLAGNDRLTGRGGPDLVGGGPGKDTLCLRDGSGADRGDGGFGTDRAQRDPGDTLTAVEGATSC